MSLWHLHPLTLSLLSGASFHTCLDHMALLWNPGPSMANIVLVYMFPNHETLKGKGYVSFRHTF